MKNRLAAVAVLGLAATAVYAQPQPPSKLDQAIAKAEEQRLKGKPEEGIKTLTKAAAALGAEGQLALGRFQERLGNLEAAAEAYQQARTTASGPSKAEALATLTHFTLRRGKASDALAIAKEAVAAAETPSTLAALARAQVRMQDGPAALGAAEKAVAAGATNGMAQLALGEALLAIGKPVAAEAALRKAAELSPMSALAQARLATALIELKRPADAVVAAKRAIEIDDKLGEAFAALGLAEVAVDPQKNWSDAIGQAQTGATMLDVDNPIVHAAVGKVFEVSGQFDQAVASYRRALQIDPVYGPARSALIQAEMSRGNRDAALKTVQEEWAAGRPVAPDLLRLVAEDLVRRGDFAAAIPYLEKATEGMPGNSDGWALLGRSYHGKQRYEDAAEAYRKAVELAPDNANYRTTFGLILGQAGDLEGGLAQLLKVTGQPGYKDAAGWTNLGWIYRNQDKAQESIAAYQKALELDPKQQQAALGLGWAYSYTKDYDKAIEAYQKAVQIDPANAADGNLGIAWAYFFKRQLPEAKEAMAKASAAGRNVSALQGQIEKLEDAIKKGIILSKEQMKAAEDEQKAYEERVKKIEKANRELSSRTPETRSRACRDVAAQAGGGALAALVNLMQSDSNIDVRIACTQAIGTLGAAARPALRNVEAMLRQEPYMAPPSGATREQIEYEARYSDFRRALRDALAKIR